MLILFAQAELEASESLPFQPQLRTDRCPGAQKVVTCVKNATKEQKEAALAMECPLLNRVKKLHVRAVEVIHTRDDLDDPIQARYTDHILTTLDDKVEFLSWLADAAQDVSVLGIGFEPDVVWQSFFIDCINAGRTVPEYLWPMELTKMRMMDVSWSLFGASFNDIQLRELLRYGCPTSPVDFGERLHTHATEELEAAFKLATDYQLYPGSENVRENTCSESGVTSLETCLAKEMHRLDPLGCVDVPTMSIPVIRWKNLDRLCQQLRTWDLIFRDLCKLLDHIDDSKKELKDIAPLCWKENSDGIYRRWREVRERLDIQIAALQEWIDTQYVNCIQRIASHPALMQRQYTESHRFSVPAEYGSGHITFHLDAQKELSYASYTLEQPMGRSSMMYLTESQAALLYEILHNKLKTEI